MKMNKYLNSCTRIKVIRLVLKCIFFLKIHQSATESKRLDNGIEKENMYDKTK